MDNSAAKLLGTTPPPPPLSRFTSDQALRDTIQRAKREDLGPNGRDPTSAYLITPDQTGSAVIRTRQAGVLAGMALAPMIAEAYDRAIAVRPLTRDGEPITTGQNLAEMTGPLRGLLAAERVILNFMTHLTGVASMTDRYVRAAAGNAQIFDTRKTIPGMRALQKYAVECGGGHPHRHGLYDAILVKDNHLASLGSENTADAIAALIKQAAANDPPCAFIEVEVDRPDQLDWLLPLLTCEPDDQAPRIVLLDNMSIADLELAVATRDRIAPGVLLEASGGVTLETVGRIASTGVDRIAVGALTHSAPAIDIGLDFS